MIGKIVSIARDFSVDSPGVTIRVLLLLFISLGVVSLPGNAQSSQSKEKNQTNPAEQQINSIIGKVWSDDGRPMRNAFVMLDAQGTRVPRRYSVIADENGDFVVRGVAAGVYRAIATYPGYVAQDSVNANPSTTAFYVPGDYARIMMLKGCVITGTITDQEGKAVVATAVSAFRLRDLDDKPVYSQSGAIERLTDDKGNYRLYGLRPGAYLVRVSGRPERQRQSMTPYLNDAPVYHPYSTRDTAKEVLVFNGAEATNIDISYRSEQGHAITGTVVNSDPTRSSDAVVYLSPVVRGSVEDSTYLQLSGPSRPFIFNGLQDGEYELIVQYQSEDAPPAISKVERVMVKGKDVTGIKLTILPSSSLAGHINIDSDPAVPPASCQKRLPAQIENILVTAYSLDQPKSNLESLFTSNVPAAVNEKGDFVLHNLFPGPYYLETWLPGDDLYTRSLRSTATPTPSSTKSSSPSFSNRITIPKGGKPGGLTILIGKGAAAINGSVTVDGPIVMDSLRVFMVPVEREFAADTWRYYESSVGSDGKFTVKNIMPGQYWLVVRNAVKDASGNLPPGRFVCDEDQRAALRIEAETKGTKVDLKPCQRLQDQVVDKK